MRHSSETRFLYGGTAETEKHRTDGLEAAVLTAHFMSSVRMPVAMPVVLQHRSISHQETGRTTIAVAAMFIDKGSLVRRFHCLKGPLVSEASYQLLPLGCCRSEARHSFNDSRANLT